ncbi:MAG: hypothetical protein WC489_05345 [Patescibacteria group bacterium]
MRLKLFISIIGFQICVIVMSLFLLKRKNSMGLMTSISPIKQESIQKSSSNIKFFYEPKPNTIIKFNHAWLPDAVTYTFNDDSLNERTNYEINKEDKTYRIVTLGDSFTFGQNISTEYNWTELLENELNANYLCSQINKYEVINLGVFSYDTQYEVERYRLRGTNIIPIFLFGHLLTLNGY